MSVKESKRANVVFELERAVASIDKCLVFRTGCQSFTGGNKAVLTDCARINTPSYDTYPNVFGSDCGGDKLINASYC